MTHSRGERRFDGQQVETKLQIVPQIIPPPAFLTRREVAVAFGEVLRAARAQLEGLSQEHLADMADMDRTYPSLLERGLRTPSLLTLIQVARALGKRPGKMVDDVVARLRPP
jgi:DNA-binding XRE family transcriptional regulator